MSLVKYRNWLKSRENYLNSLQSDSTAMGLMKDAIKFGQYEHIASISTSKEIWYHLHNIHITQCQSVRHGSHWNGSLRNGLGDEQTCGTTLASAYVLCYLSAAWSQLQIMRRSLR